MTAEADTDGELDGLRAEIRRQVVGELGGYAGPAAVHVTPAMPKTRTDKIMRRLIRDIVVHGEPTGDTSAMEDPAALDAIAAAISAR